MVYDAEWHKKYYLKNKYKIKNYQKTRRAEHKNEIIIKRKDFYQKNKGNILEKNKEWRDNNKEKVKENNRLYYQGNKDMILKRNQEYRNNNKEKVRKGKIKGYNKNRDKYKEYQKAYNKKNKEKIAERNRKRYQEMKIKLLKIVGKGIVKCVQCGCDDVRLLEINHKNGGGNKEMIGKRSHFIKSILDGKRQIDDLEILCRVCNARHYLETKHGQLPYRIYYDK
ncbi:MAG: hypothetical protein PHQ86_08775 [Dehalococcoidales bacterium]|nr:hypothetical protein [Dehalococcoidales bacterium]